MILAQPVPPDPQDQRALPVPLVRWVPQVRLALRGLLVQLAARALSGLRHLRVLPGQRDQLDRRVLLGLQAPVLMAERNSWPPALSSCRLASAGSAWNSTERAEAEPLAGAMAEGAAGGGAYTSTILPVQEGQILTIVVGASGLAGTTSVPAGGNGGDTQVLDASNTVLAFAQGGGAGQPYPPTGGVCGLPAPGAAGGEPDSNAAISHSGPSATSAFSPNNNGAVGYVPPGFAFQPNGQFGGGGSGASSPPAQAGQGGYALRSW